MSQDVDRLHDLARVVGDDCAVLMVLAPIIAMPILHACRRVWADRVPPSWLYGYCPTRGSWPSLAEIRGLDGSRHLRCRCCGEDWGTEWLRCPFCGERDHEKFGSLVTPDSLERQKVEVCESCQGYLKTITTLAPIQPEHVMLQDLATLVLDVAALEHGYHPRAREAESRSASFAERSRLRALLIRARRPRAPLAPMTTRPALICRALLAALDGSEERRRRRKRDTTPDAIGMSLKRRLLGDAIKHDPDPETFEAWLLERCLIGAEDASMGAMRAMAREVLAECRFAAASADCDPRLLAVYQLRSCISTSMPRRSEEEPR